MAAAKEDLGNWQRHLQDEIDAAFLYRRLAAAERQPDRRSVYERLAHVEDKHVRQWRELLRDAGQAERPEPRPSWRARFMAWLAEAFGSGLIAPSLLAEESRELKSYLKLAREMPNPRAQQVTTSIARESAEHAQTLAEMLGRGPEPWHAVSSGGVLRSVVYGFNDGLTANFGLVAGVIGATVAPQALIIAGVSGMAADALSMGASGYLAATSQAEVEAHEIQMEKDEIRLMPEVEKEELALIYEAKGIRPEHAREMAESMLAKPDQMLQEKVRAELAISPASLSPLKDGLITGLATAFGAFIPVAPFLALPAKTAVWTSFALSMTAHFAVGAARSFFTGRGLFRSGFDMFVVGLGVAGVGYWIGELLSRALR